MIISIIVAPVVFLLLIGIVIGIIVGVYLRWRRHIREYSFRRMAMSKVDEDEYEEDWRAFTI